MTDTLGDLLDKSRFAEPPEIRILKDFLKSNYQASGRFNIRDDRIIIAVDNSALAGTLRMDLVRLQKLCGTDKKLVIRVG
jgi:hypothetical protein